MLIETCTFRLAAGAAEDAFLRADHALQAWVSTRAGIVRRTTARGRDGEWVVITLWWGEEWADAAARDGAGVAAVAAFESLVDQSTVDCRRYEDVGG